MLVHSGAVFRHYRPLMAELGVDDLYIDKLSCKDTNYHELKKML